VARPASQLHLALLGPPEASLGQRAVKFPTRKTLALLAYLAVETGEQQREHLAALLWPEASSERSYASLRNTLGHLRAALGQASGRAQTAYLTVTHNTLALKPDAGLDLDLQTAEQAYKRARADRSSRAAPEGSASLPLLQAAAAGYRGDFLAGFSLGDAPGFDDWVGLQREVWRRRLALILDRLSEIQFAGGEFASAAETAARWIALDALNERAYRRKMRAHFAAGERGQALDTYAACRALLATELKAEPEPDTEALAAHIRSQHAAASPAPRPPATPVAYLESQFIGRAAELQGLIERYRRAVQGQPQVLTLYGETGIGKTRLATEFLAWCRAQDAQIIQGRAFENGSHMPFQPLVEALRPWLERPDALKDEPEAAWPPPLSQLLPELRVRHPGLPPAPAAPQAAPPRLFEPLVRLMSALAGSAPLVLFLDDLQWADSATLELLQYAARRWRQSAAPVVLLVVMRSEALQPATPYQPASLSEWLAQVERELQPFHLHMGPLSQSDTLELVRSILAPPAAEFAQWVFDETRGQPFYLMETLKDLLERDVLHPRRRPNGEWAFEVDAEHDLGHAARVPSTVRAVIRARLDRLSPHASALLAAAAVLEHDLTFDRLCAVANLPDDAGLPALDELVSSHLLLETLQPGAPSAYTLANDMLRDVIYTEAGDARRRLFHRRALEVLAATEPAAVLAHHALAAGQAEAAFRHSLSAGQEALRLSAAQEARVHLERARNLARQAPPVKAEFEAHIRDLYAQLGRAYELNGQAEHASAIYAEMQRLTLKKTG
jgi:DNA-binding SARP family transcriptional activator